MKKTLFKGTMVLTCFSLFVKILSFIYKIPYQNITGDFGFYVYQQMYPLFAIVVLYAAYALPLTISELIVESNHPVNIKKIIINLSILFMGGSLLIITFNHQLTSLFNDPKLNHIIIIFAISLLLIPLLGVARGILLSRPETIVYVGIGTFIEQVTRVGFILIILFLYTRGVIRDLYHVATLSYIALLLGMFISLMYSYFILIYYKNKIKTNKDTTRINISILIKRSSTLLLSASILLLFQLVDSLTITNLLSRLNPINEAMKTKGIYDRSLPLVQASLFFVAPIISVYLPHVKKQSIKQDHGKMLEVIIFLALPATIGLIFTLEQVNYLLFQDNALTHVIQLSVISIFLYAIILALTAIKIEKPYKVTMIILSSILFKFLFNYIFLEQYGILGASLSSIFSLLLMVITMMFMYKNHIRLNFKNIIIIIISTMAMTIFLLTSQTTGYFTQLFTKVIIAMFIYFICVTVFNLFHIRTIIKNAITNK